MVSKLNNYLHYVTLEATESNLHAEKKPHEKFYLAYF